MRYKLFICSWIQSSIFTSFAQQIRRPLCVHHDLLLAARICLHLFQRLACMHHGAIRCCYLISLRTKMSRGISLWNISVCFDYNIQVL